MAKLKNLIFLALTCLVLCTMAAMPNVVAAVQDHSAMNSAGSSEIPSVALNLTTGESTLPIMGKLAILKDSSNIPINASQAAMTEAEVFEVMQEQMAEYADAGIFQWFDPTNYNAQPNICIPASDAKSFFVCWTVTFTTKGKPQKSLMLDIDDETGKILCIRYDVYDSFSMDDVWERNKTVMEAFTDIYFRQLGLTEAAQYAESTGAGYEYFERDGGVSTAEYSFGDIVYGEINMEFVVDGAGGLSIVFL